LCQPRVIMIMEKSVEWLAGETEVLGENLPQCRFVHHKPHLLPVREPGPPRWEPIMSKAYLLLAVSVSSWTGECGRKCYMASLIVVLSLLNTFKHKIHLNNM
jgi:hypothetical protein